MMPKDRDQYDDWNGNPDQPKQCASSKAHVDVLRLVGVRAGKVQTYVGPKGSVRRTRLIDGEAFGRCIRNRTAEARFILRIKEVAMDWNRVAGNWKQLKGAVKQKWGKLTDDDLTEIDGQRERLEGAIQERYGIARDETRKQVDAWYQSQGWQ